MFAYHVDMFGPPLDPQASNDDLIHPWRDSSGFHGDRLTGTLYPTGTCQLRVHGDINSDHSYVTVQQTSPFLTFYHLSSKNIDLFTIYGTIMSKRRSESCAKGSTYGSRGNKRFPVVPCMHVVLCC